MTFLRTSVVATLCTLSMVWAPSEALAVNKTVKAGGEVFLRSFYRYRTRDCSPMKVTISIDRPPAHGTLRQAVGYSDPYKATRTTSWDGRCNGVKIRATKFYYRAPKGFRGKDRVVLRMLGFNGGASSLHFNIVVE